ncbi:hypothetical protein F5X99DRAFT_404303 [Biscogniauxia marginata]|nr:hypothetical protein F5X99DRAFT_404303 [Biscogniauxia marginata]
MSSASLAFDIETLHSSHFATPASKYHHSAARIFQMSNPWDASGSGSGSGSKRTLSSFNPFSRRSSRSQNPNPGGPSSSTGSFHSRISSYGGQHSNSMSGNSKAQEDTLSSGDPYRDPPPSYDEATPADGALASGASQSYPAYQTGTYRGLSLATATTDDDPYAFLSYIDTVFLVDDSYSMTGSNWEQAAQALNYILPVCVSHDKDGIDLYFLNHRSTDAGDMNDGAAGGGYRNVTDVNTVKGIFNRVRPVNMTPTGTRLRHILTPYIDSYVRRVAETGQKDCVKPFNIIVITDGHPTDDLEGILVETAMKLDRLEAPLSQVGVQFFQVGSDPAATRALRDLDDGLSTEQRNKGMRDIVDTASFDTRPGRAVPVLSGENILKVVLGSVIKRLDRQSVR